MSATDDCLDRKYRCPKCGTKYVKCKDSAHGKLYWAYGCDCYLDDEEDEYQDYDIAH